MSSNHGNAAGSQPVYNHTMSLEMESDLKQFLKVCRPDWSLPRRRGHCNVVRACEKLKAIGIVGVQDLVEKVARGTINEELSKANKPRFSRDTLQSIRKHKAFWESLSHLSEPSYRQIGLFAPVPQMLAGKNLRTEALRPTGSNSGTLQPVTGSVDSNRRARPKGLKAAWKTRTRSSTGTSSNVSSSSSDSSDSESPTRGTRPNLTTSSAFGGSSVGQQEILPRLRCSRPDANIKAQKTLPKVSSSPAFGGSTMESLQSSKGGLDITSSTLASTLRRRGSEDVQGTRGKASVEDEDWQHAEKYSTAGASMLSAALTPHWSSLRNDSALKHAEAMMKEQEDLEHKQKLYRHMSLEGFHSPMRHHVAHKIQNRLQEERSHDAQVLMEVHQTCMSIRKNLNGMANARKNLNNLRLEARHVLDPVPTKGRFGLSVECFEKSKRAVGDDPSVVDDMAGGE